MSEIFQYQYNKNIQNLIDFLLNNLPNNTLKNLSKNFIYDFFITIDDIKDFIDFKDNTYNKSIIFRCKTFEIILISWWPNVKTTYHSHPKNGCILKVLMGSLEEELYDYKNNKTIKNLLFQERVSYIDNKEGIHKITALKPSLTLHIYSPAGFYD